MIINYWKTGCVVQAFRFFINKIINAFESVQSGTIFYGIEDRTMISFLQYRSLGQSRKASILFSEGVPLELIRETPRLKVELYALNGFYVEIFYDRFTEDPLFLQAFNQAEKLEPYLDQVNIGGVFGITNDDFRN